MTSIIESFFSVEKARSNYDQKLKSPEDLWINRNNPITNRYEGKRHMTEHERLQKAINLTMSAGYQLNREAFELLSIIAATEDPIKIIDSVIKKLETLKEKPFFIDKRILEQTVKPIETDKEIVKPTSADEEQTITQQQTPKIIHEEPFYPYAKEVEAKINVIEDPSTNLGSAGTIDDYLEYFKDRFRRTERLLRQRIDVKSATSVIDALKAQANTKLKIIAMITEKRESKQRTILTVEDLQANITVLIPQNASEALKQKARSILLDQVVCLAVVKTRSNLVIAEDIILPEIGQKTQRRASVPVYAVFTSDMHVGSTKFQREAFNRFILWLNGKYGDDKMRRIASHVKYVLVAGDIVDGVGIYPNQVRELTIRDIYKQYRLAARYIEQIPDYIEVIIEPGNHDAPRKALPQPAISNTFLKTLEESRKVHSLGNPCYLSLHGVEVLMFHGRSLDDVISIVPDMNHNHPETAMKLLLQSRHLAPVYGGKTTLSAETKDFLVIERIPDIFHAGHVHAIGYTNYRGVLVVNSGGWQEQTSYMQRMNFTPTPSKVPVVDLQTLKVNVVDFN